MTCTDGIFINDRRIDTGDCSGPQSARNVLMNPTVDMAVLETARGGILREGLAFDYCDVAVVTNIGDGDHLGISDVNTPEELAKVKRCIVEAVPPGGYAVLNANDPLVVEMAAHCHGGVVFFALDPEHPVIVRHRGVGGRAAFVRDNWIVLAEGEREERVVSLDQPAACAAAARSASRWRTPWPPSPPPGRWASRRKSIRSRAETIAADIDKVPGRFNVFEIEGATVVVDYGHNAHSLAAVIEAIGKFPHQRRTCVYSTAGDRRDCDMIRQGELLGAAFDRVILYEDHYRRGRSEGEIIGLFRKGMESASRTKEIIEIAGATKAAEAALTTTQPGELVLLQADAIDETVQWLRGYLETLAARTPADVIEQVLEEPVAVLPASPKAPDAKAITPAEVENVVLAEAQAAVKM